jgi:hypothetical protein
VLDGRAGAVPETVTLAVCVLLPPPIFVRGLSVVEPDLVALEARVLPDRAGDVNVAKVLPSKTEGTVGMGTSGSRDKLLNDPVKVTTDGDAELLCAAPRPASHSNESIVPFMTAVGMADPSILPLVLYFAFKDKIELLVYPTFWAFGTNRRTGC